ncbi:hypothetical protein RZS08_01360, partial [Arthrospira platensis SPKY1]|nr:hypothetical protein [Arthrospira platensis SPKY1]
IGPKTLIQAMGKLQGHTTSGANSLVQRALVGFNFHRVEDFLAPIKMHLRENAEIVRDSLRKAELGHCWYQSDSAFYQPSPCDYLNICIRDKIKLEHFT